MASILRLPAVKTKTGLGRSSIYAFMERNEFPQAVSLGCRSVGWLEDEIDSWIVKRVEQSRISNGKQKAAPTPRKVEDHNREHNTDVVPEQRVNGLRRFSSRRMFVS